MKYRRTTRLVLAVAVSLGISGLSGCRTSQLGAAAIVDGERITVTDIQKSVSHLREQRAAAGLDPDPGPDAAQAEVRRRVLDLVFEKAAADLGIVITDADIAAAKEADGRSDAELADAALNSGVSLDFLDQVFRQFAIQKAISDAIDKQFPGAGSDQLDQEYEKRLAGTADSMDIRINPRYGTFDPGTGGIEPLMPDYFQVP